MPLPASFLHRALKVDAAASAAAGLVMAAGAGVLDGLTGLPAPLLRIAGLVLLPYAAAVAWVGTRTEPPRAAVGAIVACNFAWAAASILLLAAGPVQPTLLGHAFVIAQAAVVAALGEWQWIALRRPTRATA